MHFAEKSNVKLEVKGDLSFLVEDQQVSDYQNVYNMHEKLVV
jgi:hypothetical protein